MKSFFPIPTPVKSLDLLMGKDSVGSHGSIIFCFLGNNIGHVTTRNYPYSHPKMEYDSSVKNTSKMEHDSSVKNT